MATKNQRRMADNEAVFRRHNEGLEKSFKELKKIAQEDNQESFIPQADDPLNFYCECSDENCTKRVSIGLNTYAKLHENRNHFVVVRGHNVPAIERIVNTTPDFCLVEKYQTPRSDTSTL